MMNQTGAEQINITVASAISRGRLSNGSRIAVIRVVPARDVDRFGDVIDLLS
jgi:hypothetical protein